MLGGRVSVLDLKWLGVFVLLWIDVVDWFLLLVTSLKEMTPDD